MLPNHCVVIHDYSKNYGCKEKFELQQTYFQRTEVFIHVSVIYRHAILEVDGVESLPDIPFIVTEHFFVTLKLYMCFIINLFFHLNELYCSDTEKACTILLLYII